jgi:NADH-quinone oxidoreductase subunit L
MLVCVGITALYSLRLVWLVFYGDRRGVDPANDGQPAMRFSLVLLAAGTLTTWLLAGGLSRLFAATLPFHQIETESTLEMVGKIFLNPSTWITLAVIAIGLGLWSQRVVLGKAFRVFKPAVASGLGFEWFNQRIVDLTQRAAAALQLTQTGQLNWNIAGLLIGLAVILIILLRGL